jgi:hypothetical protein
MLESLAFLPLSKCSELRESETFWHSKGTAECIKSWDFSRNAR